MVRALVAPRKIMVSLKNILGNQSKRQRTAWEAKTKMERSNVEWSTTCRRLAKLVYEPTSIESYQAYGGEKLLTVLMILTEWNWILRHFKEYWFFRYFQFELWIVKYSPMAWSSDIYLLLSLIREFDLLRATVAHSTEMKTDKNRQHWHCIESKTRYCVAISREWNMMYYMVW